MEKYEKDRSVSRLFDETTAEARAKLPVAVMDSGVGGLCVLREIRRILPCEELLYFGDSGYAPYGEKEPRELTAHILAEAERLLAAHGFTERYVLTKGGFEAIPLRFV